MAKTEITAERARDLAKLVRSVRSPGTTNEEVAAALEQLAGLLEARSVLHATAAEYRVSSHVDTQDLCDMVDSFAGGHGYGELRKLRDRRDEELAAERERVRELERELANEKAGRAASANAALEWTPTDQQLYEARERIATLERELAEAKADAEAAKQDSDLFEPVLQRCREVFSDLPKSVQRALLYTSEQKPAVIRTPMERREDRGRPPQASASREGAEHGE